MEFYEKLPRNKKEFALFLLVISLISVNIIAPLITCFEMGFSFSTWYMTLQSFPILWIVVILLVLLTHKPAEYLSKKITAEGDSFKTTIVCNTLCTVFLLSILLTVIGSWIGTKNISLEPVNHFFYKWPRNFTIALVVELIIAQPIARSLMVIIHKKK